MSPAQPSASIPEILAAQRLEHVRYAIRDIAVAAEQLARQGKEILPLNIGDPLQFDFRTPRHLIEAVTKAMWDGEDGYAPSLGMPDALEAIRSEAGRKGIRNIRSVFVTQGVTEAVDLALTALVNPGEDVLTPCPEYPLYSAVLAKLDARPNSYALSEAQGWEPDLEDLARKVTDKTRAIVVINPNNPTGAVYSRRTLEAIADLARRHGLLLIADEIYDKLILDGEAHLSIAALAPDVPAITFNGLSKAYLVPGWRVGWGIASGPEPALKPYLDGVHKLLRARLSANRPEQYAIRPALEGSQEHLTEVVAKLRARRNLTANWCNSNPGISCVPPQGAFYAFPRLEVTEDDEQFVRRLLQEKHVLVVHGSGFGRPEGIGHFRIVFLPQEDTLRRAYQGIGEFMEKHYA
ncbi:MAG: aminotransferase class I/II-fold pyridoxal phosphate-dependent enzyme [Terriglobia bacterium]